MPTSIYQRLLGPHFDALPAPLRSFHAAQGQHRFEGRYSAQGPTTLPAKLLARLMSLPGSVEDQAFSFELSADEQQEAWQRHFAGKTMRSCMRLQGDELVEQLGPARFHFALAVQEGELVMLLQSVSVLGLLRLPRFLFPAIVARETTSPGRLHFHVEARMPWLGLLAAYRGHLEIPATPEAG